MKPESRAELALINAADKALDLTDALDLRSGTVACLQQDHFGGEPRVRLRFTKSLSLVRSVN